MKKISTFVVVLLLTAAVSSITAKEHHECITPLDSSSSIDDQAFTFHGAPEEIGWQYGTQLKDAIHENIRSYWEIARDHRYERGNILEMARNREKTIKEIAPHLLNELKAMAEASNTSYDDVLSLNLCSEIIQGSHGGCTSWIATGDATLNGDSIYHKNRDSRRGTQVVVKIIPDRGHPFHAVVTAGQNGIAAGINKFGLAAGNNAVATWAINPFGAGSLVVNRLIVERCDSVDSAYDMLKNMVKKHKIAGGSMFFVVDEEKGAIIEVTGFSLSSYKESIIVDDVGYRSNYFIVLKKYSLFSALSEDCIIRYKAAKQFLERKKGNFTIYDCNELSRHHHVRKGGMISEYEGSICGHPKSGGSSTLLGVTFQVNETYPNELSVMWVALGLPCNTLYVPLHIISTEICEVYLNGDAWRASESVRRELRPPGELTPHLLELERKELITSSEIENISYDYLKEGKFENAASLLTSLDLSEGKWAYEEMKSEYAGVSLPAILSISDLTYYEGENALSVEVYNHGYGDVSNVAIDLYTDGVPIGGTTLSIPQRTSREFNIELNDFDASQTSIDVELSWDGMNAGYNLSARTIDGAESLSDISALELSIAMICSGLVHISKR